MSTVVAMLNPENDSWRPSVFYSGFVGESHRHFELGILCLCMSVLLIRIHASMHTMNIFHARGQKTSGTLELEVWMVVMGLESSKRASNTPLSAPKSRSP